MVIGMASVKLTITLPEAQAAAVRQMVASGRADSMSGFVQHAVALALDDVAGWQRTLDEALAETGGPLTDDERRWADEVLARTGRSVA
jgi:Arc/MetJ-type ribon-helix-helix transcriptional regulator